MRLGNPIEKLRLQSARRSTSSVVLLLLICAIGLMQISLYSLGKCALPPPQNEILAVIPQQPKLPSPAVIDVDNDGTFNGAPIYLHKNVENVESKVHCVGDNYQENAWKHKSCRFSLLCFNTTDSEFLIFQSEKERQLSEKHLSQRVHIHTSSTMTQAGTVDQAQTVSISGINLKWTENGIIRLKWFPRVVPLSENDGPISYYTLPDSAVLIPYHSFNAMNPGHLVWDDFLPIYTLLTMFQLDTADREAFLLRYTLSDGERGLWASCDLRDENTRKCEKMMNKFLPLMLANNFPYNFTNNKKADFQPKEPGVSELVCGKTAVAGVGGLTDHGVAKKHGWEAIDYKTVHNQGRGKLFYDFRNFMIRNLGLSSGSVPNGGPHRIVVSLNSSRRKFPFTKQAKLIRNEFGDSVKLETYEFSEYTVEEQIQIVSNAAIYITLCGGGAVTGMFMPRGSSLIVYYDETGSRIGNRNTKEPAMLDWDILNSMSYLRTHWMPIQTMGTPEDNSALLHLIQHELDIIESESFS